LNTKGAWSKTALGLFVVFWIPTFDIANVVLILAQDVSIVVSTSGHEILAA